MLLEETRKLIFTSEELAEDHVLTLKEDFNLVDYKISNKETKDNSYTILTVKIKHKDLSVAKTELCL